MNLMPENLNEKQKLAVQTTDGAVLVLSGAGTGKTRVLTTRIAYILGRGLALPWEILALTFTNKAALQMKNRVSQIAPEYANGGWCGTFHSVCLRILRFNFLAAGLQSNFLVFGEDDQKSILKNVLKELGFDSAEDTPAHWVEKISLIKDKGFGHIPTGKSATVYNAFNAELTRLNGVDFGDIILRVLQLFNAHPDILKKYQNQFKYILVDEFQDTNNAQHQLLQALSKGHNNICCVGDDDQSIYSWRGAEIKHILKFESNYANAQIIRLETNYRSSGNILGAANSLIKNNNERLGKDLQSAPGTGDGEKVYILTLPTDRDEARIIAQTIMRKSASEKFSDFAILIRSGNLVRTFEEEFTKVSIPYRLIGAQKFYDRMEIRDAIAYIRLLVYPFDDLSFARIISKPRRGFGDAALLKLRGSGGTLMEALRRADLKTSGREKANAFLAAFDFDWKNMTPAAAVQQLLENSGYLQMLRNSSDLDAESRLLNIRELISNVIATKESLLAFLEEAVLNTTDDDEYVNTDKDALNIMTIHAAKGLEFNTVFLPAWENDVFPNKKASDTGGLEEERRLAYVAITRGRRRVIISNTMSRFVFGESKTNDPSIFISELNKQYINFNGVNSKPKLDISSVGKMISHNELGRGVIIEDSGDIFTIAFKNKGIAKVAKKFVQFIN